MDERRPTWQHPQPPHDPHSGVPPAHPPNSQWITDGHPAQAWLVGCLLVLTAIGAIAGAAWGLITFLAGC